MLKLSIELISEYDEKQRKPLSNAVETRKDIIMVMKFTRQTCTTTCSALARISQTFSICSANMYDYHANDNNQIALLLHISCLLCHLICLWSQHNVLLTHNSIKFNDHRCLWVCVQAFVRLCWCFIRYRAPQKTRHRQENMKQHFAKRPTASLHHKRWHLHMPICWFPANSKKLS